MDVFFGMCGLEFGEIGILSLESEVLEGKEWVFRGHS